MNGCQGDILGDLDLKPDLPRAVEDALCTMSAIWDDQYYKADGDKAKQQALKLAQAEICAFLDAHDSPHKRRGRQVEKNTSRLLIELILHAKEKARADVSLAELEELLNAAAGNTGDNFVKIEPPKPSYPEYNGDFRA